MQAVYEILVHKFRRLQKYDGDSCLAELLECLLVLLNLYSNNLPVRRGQKFIYADDICLAIQGQYFSELECSLSKF